MANHKEIEKLIKRFGNFERRTLEYKDLSPGFGEWIKKLTRRRGEIVLVVPRGEGRVLLHTKPHYPEEVYRLPTGGIHRGENVIDAAKREVYEEIGFKPKALYLLGLLENVFWVDDEQYVYPSFIIQTQEFTRKPKPTDLDELISGFRNADQPELRAVALHLASLPGIWREWGRFRAAPHLWLAERMEWEKLRAANF